MESLAALFVAAVLEAKLDVLLGVARRRRSEHVERYSPPFVEGRLDLLAAEFVDLGAHEVVAKIHVAEFFL